MTHQSLGKILLTLGVVFVIGGFVMYFFGDKLKWIGNLPGDIRIERGNTKVYFPIATLVLLSVLVNLIFRLISSLK